MTVADELRVEHLELEAFAATGQDAVFIVRKDNVANAQATGFMPNAGAVAIRHATIGEFDVLDDEVIALDDKNRLAFLGCTVRFEARAPVDATNGQVALFYRGDTFQFISVLAVGGTATRAARLLNS